MNAKRSESAESASPNVDKFKNWLWQPCPHDYIDVPKHWTKRKPTCDKCIADMLVALVQCDILAAAKDAVDALTTVEIALRQAILRNHNESSR